MSGLCTHPHMCTQPHVHTQMPQSHHNICSTTNQFFCLPQTCTYYLLQLERRRPAAMRPPDICLSFQTVQGYDCLKLNYCCPAAANGDPCRSSHANPAINQLGFVRADAANREAGQQGGRTEGQRLGVYCTILNDIFAITTFQSYVTV